MNPFAHSNEGDLKGSHVMDAPLTTDLFDHVFCLGRSHGYVVDVVLVAQVADHISRGVEHLAQVGVEPKAPAHTEAIVLDRNGASYHMAFPL